MAETTNSPYINHFLQPDTVIPDPSNPQSWNRYSYVTNRPVNFNDPTGHAGCDGDYQGSCADWAKSLEYPDQGSGPSPDPDDELSGDSEDNNDDIIVPFDTDEIVSTVPGTAEQWSMGASVLDEVALAWDTLLGIYVLTWAGIGLAGGLMFEGNPVTGVAGAVAGYIIGEGSVFMSGALFPGNLVATAATAAGAIADAKSGNTSINGQLSIVSNHINLTANGQIASSTIVSTTLSTLGWAANLVTLSLPLQLAAVENDRGTFGSVNLPVSVNFSFP